MCGGLDAVSEHDLGIEVVHGCLTEGGSSILSLLLSAPKDEAARQLMTFFG